MVPPSLPSSLSVCDLISASGGWNSIFIKSNFSCIDAEAILALPYPSAIVPDRLIWHYNKDGLFTVKSGYLLAEVSSSACCSDSSKLFGWWNFLWKLQVLSKVKTFL
ncbi:hypothetical protein ACOSQ4_002311 [Xanthoceras sorbifolium]